MQTPAQAAFPTALALLPPRGSRWPSAPRKRMQQTSSIPVHEPSDVDLAERVAQRDRAAFEMLYDRYAGKALGLILRILSDRALSEDVLQEAFWRVWQRAGTYDPARASFAAWLFSIVHHSAIDELRKQRNRGVPVEIDGPEGEAHDIADAGADVAESAWAGVQRDHVQRALATLPDAQRRVIELAFFGGLTRQEIAARLHEPLGTVHTRARLGLTKLRDLLAPLQSDLP